MAVVAREVVRARNGARLSAGPGRRRRGAPGRGLLNGLLPCLLVLALATPARAGASVEEDLAAAVRLVKAEKWSEAVRAYTAIFKDHEGAPEVVARIQEIEEDLRLSLFRAEVPDPEPKELLGKHVEKFDPRSLRITLVFPNGPEPGEFKGKVESDAFLDIRLAGDVTVSFRGSFLNGDWKVIGMEVTLCYDQGRCYIVRPGFRWDQTGSTGILPDGSVFEQEATIVRYGEGESTDLYRKQHGRTANAAADYRISRRGNEIAAYIDGKKVASGSDSKLRDGRLSIKAGRVWDLEIRATVEKTHYQSLLGAFRTARYREWFETRWRPEDVIPAWARGGPAPTVSPESSLLPATAAGPPGKELADALNAWFSGEEEEFVAKALRLLELEAGTRSYVDGLMALALNRLEEAEKILGQLIGTDPLFGPAWVYRALVRFRLRDLEGARADLVEAAAKSPRFPDLILVEALLAFYDGDLKGAEQVLGDARAGGKTNPRLEELAAWVHRAARGPQWPERYEVASRNCRVSSDVSREICADVAQLLDKTFLVLTGDFPKTRRPVAPLRVYVFSGQAGFLEYAGDLGRDLRSAAGAYLPQLGEMVLFLPAGDRSLLWRTVKHEGFHAFIHEALANVPIWFNEGYAEWFERTREEGGRLRPGEFGPEDLAALRGKSGPATVPLAEFLRLDPAAFMRDAERNYAQAGAFVRFLGEAKDPNLRRLLDEYFRALQRGSSPEEACQKVFAPKLDEVERMFLADLEERLKEIRDR